MAAKTTPDSVKQIHYLAAALKAPRITEAAQRLADQARDAGWTHEDYLAAVLDREVSARNASGAEMAIRSAGFPARKSLEDFDFDHARGLKRELIAHLGTLDFVTARDNVLLLGPPGTGKTHSSRSRSASPQPDTGTGCYSPVVDNGGVSGNALWLAAYLGICAYGNVENFRRASCNCSGSFRPQPRDAQAATHLR